MRTENEMIVGDTADGASHGVAGTQPHGDVRSFA
jgi:hypothetical protein